MTLRRAFLFVTAAAALAALPACSAGTIEDSQTVSGELGSLGKLASVKATVAPGGSVTIGYEPSEYDPSDKLPFIGIEFVKPAAGNAGAVQPQNVAATGALTVRVKGEFPGNPRVLVTDESFRVVAATNAVTTESGEEAELEVPVALNRGFVLVRDDLWVRPMQFEVSVLQ